LSDAGVSIVTAALDTNNEKLVHITTTAMDYHNLCILTACGVESGYGVPMDSCQTYEFREGFTPISYVQTPAAGDTSQCVGEQVTVAGIVSTPTTAFGGEYFVQARPGGQWNGIYVYQFTNTFVAGDSAVVSGIIQEYYGMTEFVGIDYQKRIPILAPVKIKTVTPADIETGSANAESYEGAMVQLDSVDVFSLFDIHGEFTVGEGTDSVWIGTHGVYTYTPGIGSVLTVKGPLDFAYGFHKIQPRDDADIVVVTACPAGIEPGELALNLYPNHPNPFGVETSLRFSIPSRTHVSLAVYDVSGRLVSSVYEQVLDAGEYHAKWNGEDTFGARVSPGVYFVKLTTPGGAVEKKMVLAH
jgi:hypothetical protein